jgi:nucleoside-diphosphate-sugar epimerase
MGEQILTLMIPKEDLLIIRPCFVYGGKYDHASVITSMIRAKLFNDENQMEIPLSLNNFKDYYYIDDFLFDLYKLIDCRARGTFNLAKGDPTTFREVMIELDRRKLVPNVVLQPEKDYLGDHYVSDKKARDIIGPTDKVELGEGIELIVKELLDDRN